MPSRKWLVVLRRYCPGLPIHNISGAKDFVRLHPDETTYWSSERSFVNVPIKGQTEGTMHLIKTELAKRHLPTGRLEHYRLALATKPHNVFFLCQMRARNLENSWNKSHAEACELAKTRWVMATSLKPQGLDKYKIDFARNPEAFPEPKWPSQSLNELLAVTFNGRMIMSEDDPALLRLVGDKQALK
jgi:hypothetical protein